MLQPVDKLQQVGKIDNLQQGCCCHQADIRMYSHRLLRLDDNKSAASCQQICCTLIITTLFTSLMQIVLTTCSKSENVNLWQVWISKACWNLIRSTDLLQVVDNLQRALKIYNLQQGCGVPGCVETGTKTLRCVIRPDLLSVTRFLVTKILPNI